MLRWGQTERRQRCAVTDEFDLIRSTPCALWPVMVGGRECSADRGTPYRGRNSTFVTRYRLPARIFAEAAHLGQRRDFRTTLDDEVTLRYFSIAALIADCS